MPVLQDPLYRSHVLHLGDNATDSEMWELLAMHFNCRWVGRVAAGQGGWRGSAHWAGVSSALCSTCSQAHAACLSFPPPPSPLARNFILLQPGLYASPVHPAPALPPACSVQTVKRKHRHAQEALNNGTLGVDKGELV